MAASALNLDLSDIAVDELESPVPIANALATVQSTMNNLGNIHVASDAAIATSKLELGSGSSTVITLNNNIALQAKVAAGTVTDLAKIDTANYGLFRMLFDGTHRMVRSEIKSFTLANIAPGAQSAQTTWTFTTGFSSTSKWFAWPSVRNGAGADVNVHIRTRDLGSLTFYVDNNDASVTATGVEVYGFLIGYD